MKRLFFTSILVIINISFGICASYYTRSTGVWTGNIWGTTTTGTGSALPALANGDILYIDDNISLTSIVSIGANITIVISARLEISGQLTVGSGSGFQLSSGGQIIPNGPGNSEKIFIGTGPSEWTGNDGTIAGPGSFSNGWVCCTLPIKLREFRGIVSENHTVVLHWTTIMEENFSKFVVQRSPTGTTFYDLAEIAASGRNKSNFETSYSFEDVLPLAGFNYYRLKGIDVDGAFEIFDPIFVRLDARATVSVYPNPVTNSQIKIHLNFTPGENDRVRIFNQYGTEVLETSVTELNTALGLGASLSTGVYYLKYSSTSFNSTVKLVVK